MGLTYLLFASLNSDVCPSAPYYFQSVSTLTNLQVVYILNLKAIQSRLGKKKKTEKKTPKTITTVVVLSHTNFTVRNTSFETTLWVAAVLSSEWKALAEWHTCSGCYTWQNINTRYRFIFCLELKIGSGFIISLQEVLYDIPLLYLLLVVLWASAG